VRLYEPALCVELSAGIPPFSAPFAAPDLASWRPGA